MLHIGHRARAAGRLRSHAVRRGLESTHVAHLIGRASVLVLHKVAGHKSLVLRGHEADRGHHAVHRRGGTRRAHGSHTVRRLHHKVLHGNGLRLLVLPLVERRQTLVRGANARLEEGARDSLELLLAVIIDGVVEDAIVQVERVNADEACTVNEDIRLATFLANEAESTC